MIDVFSTKVAGQENRQQSQGSYNSVSDILISYQVPHLQYETA